jgi:2-phospho-L-lactate guanylyltransferase
MTDTEPDVEGWVVVVPVKSLALAKSRLAGAAGVRRPELALAMAADTVAAARAASGVAVVIVVTNDRRVAAAVAHLGAVVAADEPGGGLNAAFLHGVERARRDHPGLGVALLAGDLPALRPADLAATLALAGGAPRGVVVADADGTGTTLLASRTPASLRPSFGPDSFARHRALGAVAIELDGIATLRADVDGPASLEAAIRLGVGPATQRVLGSVGATPPT